MQNEGLALCKLIKPLLILKAVGLEGSRRAYTTRIVARASLIQRPTASREATKNTKHEAAGLRDAVQTSSNKNANATRLASRQVRARSKRARPMHSEPDQQPPVPFSSPSLELPPSAR